MKIIVPIYRNEALVKDCVDSVLKHIMEISKANSKLILLNDSPDDEGVIQLLDSYAQKKLPYLQILHNESNLGFIRTVNRGLEIALAEGSDAILINSDTITYSGTLSEILKVAKSDPQIGFVSPRSNNAAICSFPRLNGAEFLSPEDSFTNWRIASRTLPPFHFAPTAVGFYMYISHAVLANIGLLSEEFGVGYEEENDLVMRAGKVGYRAVIANHAFAYHEASASFNLTGINLDDHRLENLKANIDKHPEYIPLVRKYEASATYRAEGLMGGLLPDVEARLGIAFDLRGLGTHHNGTNEHAVAMLRSVVRRCSSKFKITAIASRPSLAFHGLLETPDLHVAEPEAPGLHAIAVRVGQPYDVDHLSYLEMIAPINVHGMLDTISEDCGPLAISQNCDELWQHASRYSNALLFNSSYSEQAFCTRYPMARSLPRYTQLLPTRLKEYFFKERTSPSPEHVLILGNQFPHKGVEEACGILSAAFPDQRFVVLGSDNSERGNVTMYRSGLLEQYKMNRLFQKAVAVVLPSYVEGFGFGIMKAIASGGPVVAREIPATMEILNTFRSHQGVYLFKDNTKIIDALRGALKNTSGSSADDEEARSWDDLADAFSNFCQSLVDAPDIYHKTKDRILNGDYLRRALRGDMLAEGRNESQVASRISPARIKSMSLDELLELKEEEFVECAYMTLLRRTADPSGAASYVSLLNRGGHRLDVLRSLRDSLEGQQCDAELPGLDDALALIVTSNKKQKNQSPFFSSIFRLGSNNVI